MNESLLDDVNSLLDGDFGDDRILKQIARACKNNEVISNYERNYVQKLAEQYLGRKPEHITKAPEPTEKIPDIIMPKIETSTIQAQTFQPSSSNSSNSSLKNPKLILGFGSIALVLIVATIILFSINTDSPVDEIRPNITPNVPIQLSVQSDLTSYSHKDIISVSGMSTNSQTVNISIQNSNNELIWAEQISVKNSGAFSTLAIAGGVGWENSGTYTLKVDNGIEMKSLNFLFTS